MAGSTGTIYAVLKCCTKEQAFYLPMSLAKVTLVTSQIAWMRESFCPVCSS